MQPTLSWPILSYLRADWKGAKPPYPGIISSHSSPLRDSDAIASESQLSFRTRVIHFSHLHY
ncbi:hypothetical protein SynBIOSE41_03652 [Synechococcus sp. BIOS-E4-1]|nr:hypothetical protein SynBIOSE41_03652 [Synechococcus sp. BIOS-E4-1]